MNSLTFTKGILIPNMTAKIVDPETGKTLPPGPKNVGELWVKGPNVMKGYWRQPEATANAIDKDGQAKSFLGESEFANLKIFLKL